MLFAKPSLLVAALIPLTWADVTILTGGQPLAYVGPPVVATDEQLFRVSAPTEFYNQSQANVLLTSYDDWAVQLPRPANPIPASEGIRPSSDSFVSGAIDAWGRHQHLVIRPDEVWFTILVQMNFYMIRHAEEVRHLFVNHTGQQEIKVETCCSWHEVLTIFQYEIQERVNTPWLLDWIKPGFTTTTESDEMTANVLIMGLMQAFFTYTGGIVCGLPSVTLLGTQADWQKLLVKLDRLADFGAEPAAYANRLRPILRRFVRSFQEPDSVRTRNFWNQIVTAEPYNLCGAPPYFLSGWIVGFHYWTERGYNQSRGEGGDLVLDGVKYPRVGITQLPSSYATVPFKMLDYGDMDEFPALLLAGNIGKKVVSGAPQGYADALARTGTGGSTAQAAHGYLQPLSGWALLGPIDYNRTKLYGQADEPYYLVSSVNANYNAAQCDAAPVLGNI
jgi:hypothetical protein